MSLSEEWVNTELSNSEFEVLEEFLEKLPHILAPGGRVAILTFHSGEDRLVKKIWKRQQKMCFVYFNLEDQDKSALKLFPSDVISLHCFCPMLQIIIKAAADIFYLSAAALMI